MLKFNKWILKLPIKNKSKKAYVYIILIKTIIKTIALLISKNFLLLPPKILLISLMVLITWLRLICTAQEAKFVSNKKKNLRFQDLQKSWERFFWSSLHGKGWKQMYDWDNLIEKFYAMKIIPKSKIQTEDEKIHTMSERYILEDMDHPFIVKLHYAFQNSKKLYLLVDLLPGGELFFLLRKHKKFP